VRAICQGTVLPAIIFRDSPRTYIFIDLAGRGTAGGGSRAEKIGIGIYTCVHDLAAVSMTRIDERALRQRA